MIISCNTIVDRRDHVQYLAVSKSYSDNSLEDLTLRKQLMFGGRPNKGGHSRPPRLGSFE